MPVNKSSIELVYDNFDSGLSIVEQNHRKVISIPELVRPSDSRVYVRGYSVQLLALLQAREIDYAFEYESVAQQVSLQFLGLR